MGAPRGTKYCSAACRAAAYRERQRGDTQSGGGDGLVSEVTRRAARWEARTSRKSAHHRTRERAHEPERPRRRGWRVAFDEQVLAQAPDDAVGYRVVLPGCNEWDAPRVVPDPNVMGSPSFWRLRPFQLPDDLRLRAGKLYRLLWVDAQGALVPPVGNRHLPALRFFLGPPDDARVVKSVSPRSGRGGVKKKQAAPNHRDLAEHRAAIEVPGESPRVEPSEHALLAVPTVQGSVVHHDETLRNSDSLTSRVDVTAAADTAAIAVNMQSQASTIPVIANDVEEAPTLVPADVASSLSPPQDAHAVAPTLASSSVELPTSSTTREDAAFPNPLSPEPRSDDEPSSSPMVTVQLGQKMIQVAEATWAAAQAPLEAAQAGTPCIPQCSPPLTEAEIQELTGIILHTEKCALFMHEVECHHARVFNKPVPPTLEFHLRSDEQQRIQTLVRDPRLSRATIDLNRSWLRCRRLGPNAMYRLPPPFVSLSEIEVGRIMSTLNSPERRSYAAYVVERIEALQTAQPQPPQPTSELPPKVRRQIRQLCSDARLLTLIQHEPWSREPTAEKRSEAKEPNTAATAPTTSG
ncbi:MAG: hypothetical protein JNJ46_23320 [Myxococcales bacterium]|nr:hypothetical protein [Myxococcales bacterium]